MSRANNISEYLNRMAFRSKALMVLLIVSVIVFLVLWATVGFVLPAFLTDVRLLEKAILFTLWTIGAILFGVVVATFVFSRGLRKAVRGRQ